jgi:hypothetical protein
VHTVGVGFALAFAVECALDIVLHRPFLLMYKGPVILLPTLFGDAPRSRFRSY